MDGLSFELTEPVKHALLWVIGIAVAVLMLRQPKPQQSESIERHHQALIDFLQQQKLEHEPGRYSLDFVKQLIQREQDE